MYSSARSTRPADSAAAVLPHDRAATSSVAGVAASVRTLSQIRRDLIDAATRGPVSATIHAAPLVALVNDRGGNAHRLAIGSVRDVGKRSRGSICPASS